jgi:hypothetical protein
MRCIWLHLMANFCATVEDFRRSCTVGCYSTEEANDGQLCLVSVGRGADTAARFSPCDAVLRIHSTALRLWFALRLHDTAISGVVTFPRGAGRVAYLRRLRGLREISMGRLELACSKYFYRRGSTASRWR